MIQFVLQVLGLMIQFVLQGTRSDDSVCVAGN